MASDERHRQLSLIPYQANQEVVLRHGTTVVTRDPQSQQLTTRDVRSDAAEYNHCPFCKRPYSEESNDFPDRREPSPPRASHGFVDPDYFRMLAGTVSDHATDTSSPIGRAFRALRSGNSRNVSSSERPSGAQFDDGAPAPPTSDHSIKGSSFLPGYFQRFFIERQELGRGGRGVVLLVEHVLDGVSLGEFACKRIPVGNDHDWLAKVLVEVQLLQRLNHPNLVSYRHVWLEDAKTTKFGPSVPCVFILQQYCNAGDLHDYVQAVLEAVRGNRNGPLSGLLNRGLGQMPLDQIFSFFHGITSGLHHLHSNGLIHRDLKPSNCLLHMDGNTMSIQVSDFGEVQAANAQRASTGATGTLSYCAPEVLQQDSAGSYGNFSIKSDVFSLGMILYYMCFGDLPYANADVREENEDMDLLRAEISAWSGFSDEVKKRPDLPEQLYRFLKRLLSPNPAERPSTSDILQNIQSSSGLDDLPTSPVFARPDPMLNRVSSVESPRPPQHSALQRKRLSFSDATRGRPTASPSRLSDASLSSRPVSPNPSEATLTRPAYERRKSELLLLGPPPAPRRSKVGVWSGLRPQPSLGSAVRIALFLLKVASLLYPCSPYAMRSAVAYPLFAVAGLDLGVELGWVGSLALLGGHVAVLGWQARGGRGGLCEGIEGWVDG